MEKNKNVRTTVVGHAKIPEILIIKPRAEVTHPFTLASLPDFLYADLLDPFISWVTFVRSEAIPGYDTDNDDLVAPAGQVQVGTARFIVVLGN